MFGLEDKKTQNKEVLMPSDVPAGVIISPDTQRENRIPPGQSRTLKWPVLDAFGPVQVPLDKWKLTIGGLVNEPARFTWEEFNALPRVKVFADFHCVTRWSRLGNLWEGVSVTALLELAGGAKPEAKFVVAHGYDGGWTTNLPLAEFLTEDALVATHHDGEPLSEEHGGPARLIVPRLYAWKSAKWLRGLELLEEDSAGFWERNGYHMNGDPWTEERFGHGW
ncbi:MAG TPA: sulfite oxidase-like oxidoreductase [Bryobacteraceae bacterium]|nr:sulfite oxidase-like oxidoreductase [Bryobacteraceae bacterium]